MMALYDENIWGDLQMSSACIFYLPCILYKNNKVISNLKKEICSLQFPDDHT